MGKKIFILTLSIMVPIFISMGAANIYWNDIANRPSAQTAALGTAFTYQGRLEDGGQPANGTYDFDFKLYDHPDIGEGILINQVKVDDLQVTDGLVSTQLDFGDVFDGTAYYLEVAVRTGSSQAAYTTLSPRQALTAAPYALFAANAAGEHDHLGQTWTGYNNPLVISGTFGIPGYNALMLGNHYEGGSGLRVYEASNGIIVNSVADKGIKIITTGNPSGEVRSGEHDGIEINGAEGNGIYVGVADNNGIQVEYSGLDGMHIYHAGEDGVHIAYTDANGVNIGSANADGVYVSRAGNPSMNKLSSRSNGVEIAGAEGFGVYIGHANVNGMEVNSAGYDALYVNQVGRDGVRIASASNNGLSVYSATNDGVFIESAGRDYIRAGIAADLDFRVDNSGTAYADGGWQGSADFAELMDTDGDPDAYEPGDVLVISLENDRSVALSSEPYSSLVAGIFSLEPGFIGSPHVMEGQLENEIPVAILGIVPCKVTTENGPIHRGDLLVTSSLPGHAMRADNPIPGTILGKALENLESGTGIILVLVSLH